VDVKTGGDCVPWLNEGVAQWYESKYAPTAVKPADTVDLAALSGWDEQNPGADRAAGSLAAKIAGRYGEAGLQGLLTAQAEGQKLWTNP